MAYEMNPNSGSLFKNDRKESDKHPDYTGTALIEGKEMWLSAWIKTGKTGAKFMSLAFKPKDFAQKEQRKPEPAKPFDHLRDDDMDDEIPF